MRSDERRSRSGSRDAPCIVCTQRLGATSSRTGNHMTKHRQIGHASGRFTRISAIALAVSAVVVASAQSPAPGTTFRPVTDTMLQNPPPADWLSFRRTLNAWGYSPLEQIDAGNVKGLR